MDALSLCQAQQLPVSDLLSLLAAYRGDFDSTVLDAVSSALHELDVVLRGEDAIYPAFTAFAATLAQPAAAHYGWDARDTDGHLSRLARATSIGLGAAYGDNAELLSAARSRFARVVADPTSSTAVAAELRGTMLRIVARFGGVAERDQLLSLYRNASTDAERRQAILALGRLQDSALRAATLEWAVSGEVKLQDFFYPMLSVAGASAAGQEACWAFFKANYDRIRGLIAKASPSIMDAVIEASCGSFVTEQRADEVEAYFATKDLPLNQRTIEQALETIRSKAAFLRYLLASSAAAADFWATL
jgi:puromycin-sensitive aminopeptidase